VVIRKSHPLAFREWRSGDPLERGVWKIPFPAHGKEVVPDVVIAPVVGFDVRCYRLGYGGGYFDRTLASLPSMPTRIGVGYSSQRLETIFPQDHDIPMEMIVTETEVVRPN
jgi:5,10-methenyltetrahydrofolate synthetase